jgi:hypothetical protein
MAWRRKRARNLEYAVRILDGRDRLLGGLGEFLALPYTAGENGGAAFVLVYLLCVVADRLPDPDRGIVRGPPCARLSGGLDAEDGV